MTGQRTASLSKTSSEGESKESSSRLVDSDLAWRMLKSYEGPLFLTLSCALSSLTYTTCTLLNEVITSWICEWTGVRGREREIFLIELVSNGCFAHCLKLIGHIFSFYHFLWLFFLYIYISLSLSLSSLSLLLSYSLPLSFFLSLPLCPPLFIGYASCGERV